MPFFGGLGCDPDLSEDLSQEVLLTVYQKAWQLRDRTRFRAWLFTIGRHALHRYHQLRSAEADSVDLENVIDPRPAGPPAFEFHRWMIRLESHEREEMVLALCRGMGIPRDRWGSTHPDRNPQVASIQR